MSRPLLREYVEAGLVLVPIPPDQKGPIATGWNLRERCIDDGDVAEFMDGNVGLAHAYSGVVCFDIDDMQLALRWFADRGLDISELLMAEDAVQISSGREGRAKLLYKHTNLPTFKLNNFGFELRCMSRNGLTMQDVLPPSVHPDTGREYVWIGDWRNIPPLPDALRDIWEGMIKSDTRPAKPRSEKRVELPELRKLISQYDADGPYDDWIKAGMMLHYETQGSDDGFALWDEWSATGSKYKGSGDLDAHWRSFRLDGEILVTAASFRGENVATDEEFEDLDEVESTALVQAAAKPPQTSTAQLAQLVAEIERDKTGTAFATLPNIYSILAEPTVSQWFIRYDEFKAEIMFAPTSDPAAWRPIRDTDYTAARMWLENEARFYPVAKELIRDTVHYIGEQNKMDSAQEWLISLDWDGVERVRDFMPKYMGTLHTEYDRAVGVYMWTALAGRVMNPGCQVDMAPILVGRQGIGKSQGIKAMVPDPSFYVEIRLDEKDDDIARKMRGVLIGEIAELRGLRTADADRIKAFITRTHEKWTPKYMEHATVFARRLVMIGTTNEDEFLSDVENRRWLPVRTNGVDVAAIVRDREQLWAEAYQMWLARGIVWKQAEDLGKVARNEFNLEDNWEAPVAQFLKENQRDSYSTADVLIQGLGVDQRHITNQQERRIGKIMTGLGYKKVNKRFGAQVRKVWVPVALEELLA